MANHESAKKALRQTIKNTARNRHNISRIKTLVKKLESIIDGGKKDEAVAMFASVQAAIMKGVTKNLLKLNTASRKVSRLSQKLKKLATGA